MQSTEIPRYQLTSHLTRKGQVTIPAEIRRRLGLREGDKVAFIQDGDTITVQPAATVAERERLALSGNTVVRHHRHHGEEREAFAQGVAEEVGERLAP